MFETIPAGLSQAPRTLETTVLFSEKRDKLCFSIQSILETSRKLGETAMDPLSAVSLWVVGFTGLNTLQVAPLLISVFHWLPETRCQNQYPPTGRHFKRSLTTHTFPGLSMDTVRAFPGLYAILPSQRKADTKECLSLCSVPRNGNNWKQCPLWRWLLPSWLSEAEVGTNGSWSSNLRQC